MIDIDRLKKQAFLISDQLDLYYKSGGNPWFAYDATIQAWAKWITKLENVIFKFIYIKTLDKKDSVKTEELVLQNWRGENSLIDLWNSFCLHFTSEQRYFIKLGKLSIWQSFLIYRLSDKFWQPLTTEGILNTKSFFESRLRLFQSLWKNDPFKIWQGSFFYPQPNRLNFEQQGLDFTLLDDPKRTSPEHNSLLDLIDSKNNLVADMSKWQIFWRTHSGGIISQFSIFQLKSVQPFILNGLELDHEKNFANLIHNATNQKILVDNIKRLLSGNQAHHVFLWGEPGMGKSSSVNALMSHFKDEPLKLVEIDKNQISKLPQIFAELNKRPEKFIVLCDDLTLDKQDPAINTIKTALDGSLSKNFNSVLHVTSNLNSLVEYHEEVGDFTKKSQSLDLVGALDGRFGLKIYFEAPRFENLNKFLLDYAQKYKINIRNKRKISLEFQSYCLNNRHNLPSARTIQQFFKSRSKN